MTPLRHRYLFAAVGSLLVLASLGLQAQPPERVKVIISFEQPPGPNEQALVRGFGGTIRHTYWLVQAIAAEVPQAAVQALRNNPNVTSVDLDETVYEIDAELDNTWGVKHIGAGEVHAGGNKGWLDVPAEGVKVCVIDSGVDYTHPEMLNRYRGGWNYANNGNLSDDPFDDRGHGTHVTGSILALDDDAGVVGVAPEAWLYAYKILNAAGSGDTSDAIDALQKCIDVGGQVTNSSFGTQTDPGIAFKTAYDNAYNQYGLVHVAAAGNALIGRCRSVAFPARYDSVIAVTATDANNKLAGFSCTGPEAELAAPGVNINSTVPDGSAGSCTYCDSSGYSTLSGTSMASPHVAGVAALIIAYGITDNDDVRARLQQTADDLGSAGRDSNYGYGLVDALEAAGGGPVNTAPNVTITAPTSGSVFDEGTSISFTGSASDTEDGDLTSSLAWASDLDGPIGSGGSFSAVLPAGTHTITASVIDSGGAGGQDSIAVTVNTVGGIGLSVSGYKVRGQQKADLSWSGANSTNVDVFRDGNTITTTANDGFYTDDINNKGSGSYNYQVCEEGTSTCSNIATVSF